MHAYKHTGVHAHMHTHLHIHKQTYTYEHTYICEYAHCTRCRQCIVCSVHPMHTIHHALNAHHTPCTQCAATVSKPHHPRHPHVETVSQSLPPYTHPPFFISYRIVCFPPHSPLPLQTHHSSRTITRRLGQGSSRVSLCEREKEKN